MGRSRAKTLHQNPEFLRASLSQVAESTDNLYVLRSQLGGRESTEMAEGVLDLTLTMHAAVSKKHRGPTT